MSRNVKYRMVAVESCMAAQVQNVYDILVNRQVELVTCPLKV